MIRQNRHNPGLERQSRTGSKLPATLVIQSLRGRDQYAKMPLVRKSPVRNTLLKSIALAAFALPVGLAMSADFSTQPLMDLRIEQNDNINLDPGGSPDGDVLGYIADMELLFGIRTPRGNTSLRPRLKVQEYPDRDDFERIESFFDMQSRYEWQRSNFDFGGYYSRQDTYNSDTPGGDFDPLDPDGGGDPDSGALVIGETRTRVELRPTFEHRVTERTSIGISADYQTARYDADDGATDKTDYDFGVARGYLSWALDPASDFSVGGYASRYETQDDSEESDAVGGQLGYLYRWSERDGIEASLFYESNDTTQFAPVVAEETTSNWGGEFTVYRKLEVSEWRFTIGRAFIPTGDNGKSESDHFRLQYDRQLSQKLALKGVARYDSRSALGTLGGGTDRDYARADLSLKWFFSPTWYVGGGYSFIWEDREQAVDDAHNNKLFINFGYQGRGRQNPGSISGP